MRPPLLAAGIAAYLAALLAVDTQVGLGGQRALGALTWVVLLVLLTRFPPERRALALGVVVFATIGEVTHISTEHFQDGSQHEHGVGRHRLVVSAVTDDLAPIEQHRAGVCER